MNGRLVKWKNATVTWLRQWFNSTSAYQSMKYSKLFKFEPESFGDIFTLDDFYRNVKMGGFIPYDGCTGEVIIDEYVTDLDVSEFSFGFGLKFDPVEEKRAYPLRRISLKDLVKLQTDIDKPIKVVWYNR